MDFLKGKELMVWSYMGNTRMYTALKNYGDRISQIGLFCFKANSSGGIYESGVSISTMLTYVNMWPHIKWLLTVSNDGYSSIFNALRDNDNGAQDTFLTELVRIMEEYSWCDGVDIDLEGGGAYSTAEESTEMFKNIYNAVKDYDSTKLVNICLSGMTSVNGSVGGENWCVYADLDDYCDSAAIMSYGMAWAGSAPGPVSPASWLEGIYDYAVTAMTPSKIFLGMPAYGWEWQIYDDPANLGKTYRGVSVTYYAALYWMQGGTYRYADTQSYIPFISYWDETNHVPWTLMYVYDYMEGQDYSELNYPLMGDTYNNRRYITSYSKQQKTTFKDIAIDADGTPDSYSAATVSSGTLTLAEGGTATYTFTIDEAGTYDIAVKLCYPFWDKNAVYISIDGTTTHFTENRLWWPYWRTTFWATLVSGTSLSAGEHTITVTADAAGVQFYGYRVCGSFSEEPYAGDAAFTLSPRHFKDIDGNMVGPNSGFKLTAEVLRRDPDSALIWYEDFKDPDILPGSYWDSSEGDWDVWKEDETSTERVYSQLEGNGDLMWLYDGFSDIHLRAVIGFPSDSSGRAGIYCGDIFCCLNITDQAVELYNGDDLIGSYSQSISYTSDDDLRTDPSTYTVEMRIRGNTIRVYSGSSYALHFTVTVDSFSGGYAGYRSDEHTICTLLRLGDAWTYEPYEMFNVTLPDGTTQSFGRIERSNAEWDDEFNVFTLTSDVEESATRDEDISSDYDFYYTDEITDMVCGGDYSITITPVDIDIWFSRLFLGDSDGYAIMYYQDVDSLVYWANRAAYHWGLKGMCMWSLGQEDLNLWKYLPKQTE